METQERERFQKMLDDIGAPMPAMSGGGSYKMGAQMETIFDYYFDVDVMDWKLWEAATWEKPKRMAFSQLLIPTIDSTRAEYIIHKVASLPPMRSQVREEPQIRSALIVGGSGTAKTSCVLIYKDSLEKINGTLQEQTDQTLFKMINFSNATTPQMFQQSIEGEIERKQGRLYVPPGNKRMCVFIDDISMPEVNNWGDQETLEITRQLMEQKGFYFTSKDDVGDFESIEKLQFVGCMNHPGGGRNDIPNRAKRHFFSMNMTSPSQKSIENIYGRILDEVFTTKRYSQEVISCKNVILDTTIMLWNEVKQTLLPTPAKFHYVFSMRELSRTFQGIF